MFYHFYLLHSSQFKYHYRGGAMSLPNGLRYQVVVKGMITDSPHHSLITGNYSLAIGLSRSVKFTTIASLALIKFSGVIMISSPHCPAPVPRMGS